LNTKAQIIVIPRLGTISPWSSKASDILHLCGLEKIKRIERGIIYHFDRSVTDKKAVLSVIMDKMTGRPRRDCAKAWHDNNLRFGIRVNSLIVI
jgi:hypothetical protein